MTVKQVAMVTIQVRDFDAMLSWYRDALGLTTSPERRSPHDLRF